MLILGGRERNEAEWRALLEDAGFEVEQIEDGLVRARCR
jgi:cobalamin biosynthesis Co2+ chelatase CbiK